MSGIEYRGWNIGTGMNGLSIMGYIEGEISKMGGDRERDVDNEISGARYHIG